MLKYNATFLALEEGLLEACNFAANNGHNVEAIAMNATSFWYLCNQINKLFTSTPETTLWMKIKKPDGSVESILVYADPSVPFITAHLLDNIVLYPEVVSIVELSC